MDEYVCVYTDKNDPTLHCIVGQVLVDAGIDIEGCPNVTARNVVRHHLALVPERMTYEAAGWLSDVQDVFDRGSKLGDSWSVALKECQASSFWGQDEDTYGRYAA